MSKTILDTKVLKDPGWWHWTLTVPLLAAHLGGVDHAITTAVLLCLVMTGYYFARIRSVKPFPVQIRIAYQIFLVGGTIPGFQWLHWIALVGTTARVITGYCLLARQLTLLPFNRTEPLSRSFVWRVFFKSSCAGGLINWASTAECTTINPCSLVPEEQSLPVH